MEKFPALKTPNRAVILRVGYEIDELKKADGQPLSASRRRDFKIVLERYALWLKIYDDPVREIPIHFRKQRQRKSEIEAVTYEQAKQILYATKDRDEALVVHILFKTGMRREEVSALNIEDIDLGGKAILVHGKGNKERKIDLDPELENSIRGYMSHMNPNYRDKGSNPLIRSRLGERYAPDGIGEIAANCGERVGIRITTHMYRHTFATLFVNSGGNPFALQRLMGHDKLETTLGYYTFSEVMRKGQYQAHAPKFV